MTTPFWKGVVASLPPEVQRRYARDLAAAERFEPALDLAIEAAGFARLVLGRCCRAVAHGLRVAAGMLDAAARRLVLRP